MELLVAKYSRLTRVSNGAVFNAHRNILRMKTSALTKTGAPPYSCKRAGPMHPKITLPYSNVVTAMAYMSYILTLLLNRPGLYTLTDRPGPAMAGQVRSFVRI